MIATRDITGLVLAGGLGRRMSPDGHGIDKGLVPFRGRPMVAHVIERLEPQVATVLINANRNAEAYRAFGHPVIADAVGEFAGPLAGLHAGLAAAQTPWVVTAPCDSPFLPTDLVERLGAGLVAAAADIAIARAGARTHPVFALVDRSLLGDLEGFLAEGGRKIDLWYARLPFVEVDFEDKQAFRNINTTTELAEFEQP